MEKIDEIIKKKYRRPEIKKGPNSHLAESIEQLILFMGETNERYGYWIGRTNHLSPGEIKHMVQESKRGKNPQALFNHLLKKSNE